MTPRALRWARVGLIAALAAWIYWPALRGEWLWDDRADVPGNPLLRDAGGLARIWFEPGALPDYYPIKASVQWLQWQLWGESTPGYHVTNVVLHVVAALLFWRLLSRLGLRSGWLGALVFTVHPVMVESVAWIAELKNTLSLPPLLLACLAFLDFDLSRRRADLARAVTWFLVAMLCKTSVVMLPVALLLFVRWRRGRVTVADVHATAPFFVVSLALGLLTVWLQHTKAIGEEAIPLGGPVTRTAAAGLTLGFYFFKSLVPSQLATIYPRWTITTGSLALGALIWLAFAALAWRSWRSRDAWAPSLLLGTGWFALHLLPFLGFTPISYFRFTPAMDHFLHVPLLGLIGLVVAAIDLAGKRAMSAALAGCLALTAMSRGYAATYRDPISLWSHAARVNPAAWPAHNNLGFALATQGRTTDAIRCYETALRLNPDYVDAHNNLGNAFLALGRPQEAAAQFRAALAVKPRYAAAHNNLGVALRRLGTLEAALPEFATALELRPNYVEAHQNLGITLLDLGRAREAVPHYEAALRAAPDYAEAHYTYALALRALGEMRAAREHYEEARRLKPGLPALTF